MRRRSTSVTLAFLIGTTLLAALPADAAGEETYGIEVWEGVDRRPDGLAMQVLVIPPPVGQVRNSGGLLGGGEPQDELHPFQKAYVRAIEDATREWTQGAHEHGPTWLAEGLSFTVHVLGRDTDDPSAYQNADIVIDAGGVSPLFLGVTTTTARDAEGPCIIHDNTFGHKPVASFTYADMYNVHGHEFGHCLGLNHNTQEPPHGLMNAGYTHFPGRADTHLHCVSNLEIAGVAAALQHLVGLPARAGEVTLPVSDYQTTDCESRYGGW